MASERTFGFVIAVAAALSAVYLTNGIAPFLFIAVLVLAITLMVATQGVFDCVNELKAIKKVLRDQLEFDCLRDVSTTDKVRRNKPGADT